MNAEFVSELRNGLAGPKVVSVNGREQLVVPPNWSDKTRGTDEVPRLAINTLRGLTDYLESNVDDLQEEDLLVHVVDERHVELRSNVVTIDGDPRRHLYVATEAPPASPYFGNLIDSEVFTVWLQTGFVQTPAREELIRLVASIRENSVKETVDDGVAQEVKTAAGIIFTERTKVPNPVALRPWRTFREVEQPESLFVIRMKSSGDGEKPKIALFEADGGAWKLEAINSIREWLSGKTQVAIVA